MLRCEFRRCDGDANPDAEADQGGAFPVNGVLSLWDAKTQAPEEIPGSDIGIGDSIAINTPTSITIVDTDWEPYEGARTVFLGGALGGCQEHPCELGHSYAYSNLRGARDRRVWAPLEALSRTHAFAGLQALARGRPCIWEKERAECMIALLTEM